MDFKFAEKVAALAVQAFALLALALFTRNGW
jgi:hypothetical protein